MAFAYALLHEPVTPQLIAGGIVILGGIVLIATEKVVIPEESVRM